MIKTIKLNESFYRIEGSPEQLQPIIRQLKVEVPGARFDPMVKRGLKPSYQKFYNVVESGIIVPSGVVPFLAKFGAIKPIEDPIYTEEEIIEYIKSVNLPFEPYDYQQQAIIDSILNKQQLCLAATGSGKSIILSLICGFLMFKGLKGLILVPSISLTTQLKQDIKDYNLDSVYNSTHLIGGDNNIKNLDAKLTLSTWQSAKAIKDQMKTLDYIIIDESHGLKVETESADIVYKAINAKYRIGLTGTLPEDPTAIMSIISCVGAPKVYIRTQGLIERGFATPVNINILKLHYNNDDKALFRHVGNYTKQLQFIKEHENRNRFISKFAISTSKLGNSVIMCSHVQHMKDIFIELMQQKYPEVDIENKHITGKNAFEFQSKYNIYYIAGSTKANEREKIISILREHDNSILVTNYSLFSTGINLKSIKNILFASPLKSYTTITQSIGRAIRLHVSKTSAEIYDFADAFTPKGPFMKQLFARIEKSYKTEGFPIYERDVHI